MEAQASTTEDAKHNPKPLPVRASLAPLAQECAGAIILSALAPAEAEPEEEQETDAGLGTLAHAALAEYVREGKLIRPLESYPEGARKAIVNGMALWSSGDEAEGLLPLRTYLDGASETFIEYRVDSDELGGGTLDVAAFNEDTGVLFILDWKTGHKRRDATAQLASYALLLAKERGIVPSFFALLTVFPRIWDWELKLLTFKDALKVRLAVRDNATKAAAWLAGHAPGDLSPFREGPHCLRCYRQAACPARQQLLATFAAAAPAFESLPPNAAFPEVVSPEDAAAAYRMAQWLDAAGDWLKARLRLYVEANGAVPLGDGTALALRQTAPGRDLQPTLTIEALHRAGWTEAEIGECLKVQWGAVEKAARAKAPARGKAKAVEALDADLRVCGALTEKPGTWRMEPVALARLAEAGIRIATEAPAGNPALPLTESEPTT